MKTTATKRITGSCPLGYNRLPRTTPKAVYVTVRDVDGEELNADTTWLPRSIATDLKVEKVTDSEGSYYQVTAMVPAWWVAKLDSRPGWVRRGERHAPFAQRPM